jgi:SpoIIAA-like
MKQGGFVVQSSSGRVAMIELLQGFPENVVAVAATGKVTKSDYETVLVRAVEKAFEKHDKLRFYYELGPEFQGLESGAAWEDFKLGVTHLLSWERVAVVTNVEWIRHAVSAFALLTPGRVRTFSIDQKSEALAWLATP